jgi:hypothetical protein
VVGIKDAALEQKNETVEISTGGQATKKSHFRNLEKYFFTNAQLVQQRYICTRNILDFLHLIWVFVAPQGSTLGPTLFPTKYTNYF